LFIINNERAVKIAEDAVSSIGYVYFKELFIFFFHVTSCVFCSNKKRKYLSEKSEPFIWIEKKSLLYLHRF